MVVARPGLPVKPFTPPQSALPTPPAREMVPTYFVSVHLDGLDLDRALESYADWIEGAGPFASRAGDRAKQGVPQPLDRRALWSGKAISAGNCEIVARREAGRAVLRFVHADHTSQGVSWWTVATFAAYGGRHPGLHVEHTVARVDATGSSFELKAGVPAVLRALFETPGIHARERDANCTVARFLNPADVDDYVQHELLNPERVLPHVLLSPDLRTGQPLVDAARLVQRIAGQAVVMVLRPDASRAVEGAFERRGFHREMGSCYGGAIRIYRPNLTPNDDPRGHFLWLPQTLRANLRPDPRHAAEQLAPRVVAKLIWRSLPPRLFHAIDDWDREGLNSHMRALLLGTATHGAPSAAGPDLTDEVQRLRDALAQALTNIEVGERQRVELEDELATTRAERDEWEQMSSSYANDLAVVKRDLEHAEHEHDATKTRLWQATAKADAVVAPVPSTVGGLDRNRVFDWLRSDLDLPTALAAVAEAYPDRVTVLPCAHNSAAAARGFEDPRRALGLMHKLATDYWDALSAGRSDAEARGLLGDAFSAKEAGLSTQGQRARTVQYQGVDLFMERHLKIGTKDSVARCWRLHFYWDADARKFIIGHCGGHLPL